MPQKKKCMQFSTISTIQKKMGGGESVMLGEALLGSDQIRRAEHLGKSWEVHQVNDTFTAQVPRGQIWQYS